MKARHWILLILLGGVLLDTLPGRWSAVGLLILITAPLVWALLGFLRSVDQRYKTRHQMYLAMEQKQVVHRREFVRVCGQPASVVRDILSKWLDEGLVAPDSPEGADTYHITARGQVELSKRYGNPDPRGE